MAAPPAIGANLSRLIASHILTQSICVVAELGVVDAMPAGTGVAVDELASRVGADADALYRVLRALAAEGLFTELAPQTFAVTETGELLRDGDSSMRYLAIMHGRQTAPLFLEMLGTVRTGTPAPVLRHGKSRWEILAASPEDSEVFNRAMRGRAAIRAAPLALMDWSATEVVVDVGGGSGGVLLPLLQREPHLHGVLFDLEHLAAEANAAIVAAGVAARCRFEAGSFFERVPGGGDVYLLSNILHDWPDAEAVQILAACRSSIDSPARLVVLESLLRRGDDPDYTKILDLQMLVAIGGRERSDPEFRALLDAAGFALERIVGDGVVAIEARPV